jgi:hypothetical protein
VKDLKDLSQQGRAADSLLNNKTLQKAFTEMKANAMAHIIESKAADIEIREDLYRFIKVIDKVNDQLKIYFNKGSNAAFKLEQMTEKQNGGKRN